MAKFIYRMQSILNIKEKLEEQAKMDFAEAKIRLDEEEEKLVFLQKRKEGYVQQGRELQAYSLSVKEIIQNRDAISTMKEFIELQKNAVAKAEKRLESSRAKLQTAMQESKTQIKLKEKAFEEFMKEENAREAKEVDELVSYTYGQRNRE